MASEGLSNSDLELEVIFEILNEIQIKFNEEKEKILNLENELKEMKKVWKFYFSKLNKYKIYIKS